MMQFYRQLHQHPSRRRLVCWQQHRSIFSSHELEGYQVILLHVLLLPIVAVQFMSHISDNIYSFDPV